MNTASSCDWIRTLVPVMCKQEAIWCLEETEEFLQALLKTALLNPNISGILTIFLQGFSAKIQTEKNFKFMQFEFSR